jgi:2-deoxystreptamine N-acetyl-D-glucosaminyltransferase/2-deoxystreptamine glucosyltransferase
LDERTVIRGVSAPTAGRPGPIRRHLQWLGGLAPRLADFRDHGVVHAHTDCTPWPALGALLGRRRTARPLVATVHCSSLATYSPVSRRDAAVQRLARQAERSMAARAASVFTLTERTAERIGQAAGLPAGTVGVMPDSLDLRAFRAGASPEAGRDFAWRHRVPTDVPVVAYVGRVNPDKGWRDLLALADALEGRAHVLVCGGGEEESLLRAEVSRRGLESAVTVTGLVAQDEVPAALALARVFVLPSRFEELGSAAVEAIALGVPAVAYDVGGVSEAVRDGETGLLAAPGDVGSLAGAVRRLLDDPGLHARLAAAGPRLADERYDVESACDRLVAAYERALAP